jgi:hypothetical protein
MAEADRWFEPVPATVIQDCSFALQESEIPLEGAIGFKSPGKEQGVGATSESIVSTDYKAYERFAIALLPSAVPGDLIVGPPSHGALQAALRSGVRQESCVRRSLLSTQSDAEPSVRDSCIQNKTGKQALKVQSAT